MPLWSLECLLQNKIPAIQVTKVSFVLLPFKEAGVEPLPELLNTYVWSYTSAGAGLMSIYNCSQQSKLTASRFLRVRKLTVHVRLAISVHQDLCSRYYRCRTSSTRSQMGAEIHPCP